MSRTCRQQSKNLSDFLPAVCSPRLPRKSIRAHEFPLSDFLADCLVQKQRLLLPARLAAITLVT